MTTRRQLHQLAEDLLARDPGPAVTSVILRELYQVSSKDTRLQNAQRDLDCSPMVQLLELEQWGDGSWGRLHTQDTRSKQKIPTTEWAVERAIRLGVEPSHKILQNATTYLISVGRTGQCHDRPEVNDRWATGVRLFAASTLSWIEPEHPALMDAFDQWLEILHRTFIDGGYNADAEIQAHQDLTGASVRGSYLRLNNKYTVRLLGCQSGRIPKSTQIAYLNWLKSISAGLLYLPQALKEPPPLTHIAPVEHWFRSIEILSEFEAFTSVFSDLAPWFWDNQGPDGYWNFGKRLRSSPSLPLSESWRSKNAQRNDWTTRVLILLTRIID